MRDRPACAPVHEQGLHGVAGLARDQPDLSAAGLGLQGVFAAIAAGMLVYGIVTAGAVATTRWR